MAQAQAHLIGSGWPREEDEIGQGAEYGVAAVSLGWVLVDGEELVGGQDEVPLRVTGLKWVVRRRLCAPSGGRL